MGRTSIAVSDEIAAELTSIASRDNRTSYALANECLGAALKICEKGGRPDEIYGAWIMNHIGKDVGTLQWIGRDVMERSIKELDQIEPKRFLKIWYDAGHNFGVYLQICFPTIEDVASLVEQLKSSFNIGRVRLTERGTSREDHDHVYALSVITSFSAEVLTYLAEYWRGILAAYGLEAVESNIATGVISIIFASHGKLMKAIPQSIK